MTDYIDPHSEHSLYDILAGDVPPGESTEYMGFHLVSENSTRFMAQLDGHVGRVKSFDADDYDDVLELVSDLNTLVVQRHQYDYSDDKDALVDWAGKIMTADEERAEEKPELYVHIPDRV